LACDQACIHCGPRAGAPRPDELTTEEALRVVGELADLGVKDVVLIGGEAYLREDCPLVIRAIRERGMGVSITTGGYNIDAGLARLLGDAGLVSASVSIDGLGTNHDRLRARTHSFRRAIAALEHLRSAGVATAVNSQINALTLPDLLPLLDRIAALGIDAWQLQITVPHGRAADNADIVLQPYMMLEVFRVVDEILVRADRLGVRIWAGNSLGYFGPGEAHLRRFVKPATRHFEGCEAGQSGLALESDGRVKSCPSLGGHAHTTAGSVRDHDLRSLWENAPELLHLGNRTLDDLWGWCRDCYYAEPCLAGCTAASEPLLGRPGNNPYCHHRARTLAEQGLRERVEQVSSAPAVGFGAGRFRILREAIDPARRADEGVVAVEEWTGE
jgi:radical SAM protein with 4Fe4S-binding SPASM domain